MNRDGTTDDFDRDAEDAEDAARTAAQPAAEDLRNAEQMLAFVGTAPQDYNVGGALWRASRLVAQAREKMRARDEADWFARVGVL